MNTVIKEGVKLAKNDSEFIAIIKTDSEFKIPGFFSDNVDKGMFCATYCGYLVGKYGNTDKASDYTHALKKYR